MEKQTEKLDPLQRANIFSYLTFGYILELIKKGWRQNLTESDLFGLPDKCKSKFNGQMVIKQWKRNRSLFKLFLRKFGLIYLCFCLAHIVWTEIRSILRPYGMSKLISFFDKKQNTISETDAYYCASIVIFTKFFQFIFMQNIQIFELKYMLRLKTSLQSLVYDKLLRLSSSSVLETSSGNLITVITKDIHNVESNLWVIKEFLIFFVQTTTVFYLLWRKVGISALVALGMFAMALPLQGLLCGLVTKLRLKVCANSDERLQITQEALSAIRVIKMYTWESFFIGKISNARNKEVSSLLKMLFIHFLIVVIGLFLSGIVFLVLILFYIWMGNDTNTELIFYVESLFHEITISMGIMIPLNMSRTAELIASLRRIEKVFQCQEISKIEKVYKEALININNVTVLVNDKKLLDDVSLRISKPGLHVITGVVGSGKSSILKVIVGMHNLSEGYCKLGGKISLAAQEPWLFPSSIKNNILFGKKYDKFRYEEVLKVCGLDYDMSFLRNGDQTIVAEAGINLSKGQQARVNLARCVYKESDVYLLDDPLTALDANVQDEIFNECVLKFLKNKICVLISQNPKHIEKADTIYTISHGKLIGDENIMPYTEELPTDRVETKDAEQKVGADKAATETENNKYTNDNMYIETNNTGTVKMGVYNSYVKFGGGYIFLTFIVVFYSLTQAVTFAAEKLKAKWVDLQSSEGTAMIFLLGGPYGKQELLKFFTVATLISSLMALGNLYALLRFCCNASYNIHKAMLTSIVTAVMSFFDKNYLGNVVNRFSYDLNIIDERLPTIFLHLFRTVFFVLGSIVLVASVNWIFLFPSIFFMGLVFSFRYLYINTGRNLKRLEAATRSPLVGHINSTLDGLSTIRAFDAEKQLTNEFYRHQDLYSSAIFTTKLTRAGFGFYMGALSATFSTIIIAKFLFFPDDTSAGNVGLALSNVIRLSDMVMFVVNEWIEIETNMTSVERCVDYTSIPREDQTTGSVPPDWPKTGGIEYKRVELKYGDDENVPVLKNINFTVRGKHNIGIVGRTGAGKSSIISTLFRLYDYDGIIEIDGVNTRSLPLSYLRKNMAIIPQDPVLFSGTLRENVDPYNEHSDDKIWSLLKQLTLENMESLDAVVSNFSAGQKQLICMARAALRDCKIIVLDEITANMDVENDDLIHSLVEKTFKECTILTIAHRLNFILSCDMVIVMQNGNIVEFDEPKTLLEDENSIFAKICDKASS